MSDEIDPSIELAARIIARNVEETQLQLALVTIKQAGLLSEFKVFFLEKAQHLTVLDAMIKFAKLHPDMFHVTEETESYGKVIVVN